jgi:hypothetical protein
MAQYHISNCSDHVTTQSVTCAWTLIWNVQHTMCMYVTFLAPLVNQIMASKLKLHKMFVQSLHSYFTYISKNPLSHITLNVTAYFLYIYCHTSFQDPQQRVPNVASVPLAFISTILSLTAWKQTVLQHDVITTLFKREMGWTHTHKTIWFISFCASKYIYMQK